MIGSNQYEAAQSNGRRRPAKTRTYHEDAAITAAARRALLATTDDQIRNFSLTSWVIRKHLDYTTHFSFQAATGDTGLDADIERLIADRCHADRCHTARRHPLRRFIRLAEARRLISGDVLIERLTTPAPSPLRGTLNPIEADRIANAYDLDNTWRHGVRLNRHGAITAYSVLDRTDRRTPQKILRAQHAYLHAYHDSHLRFDSSRGVSPLAAALNQLRDTSDGFTYALAKLKISQLFGLAITAGDEPDPEPMGDPTEDSDGDGVADQKYEIDLGKGPFQLELEPGEDAKFLDSKTPPTETVNFLNLVIACVLKALDLPYSFFDESHTNFFGSRGALMHYLRSAKAKQADCVDLLNWITAFWLDLAIADGDLAPPRQLTIKWEWIPDGVPWWDPSKEISGNLAAVGSNLDNLERICRATGTDFYDNVDANARAMAYAANAGAPVHLPAAAAAAPDPEDEDQ